MTCVIGKFLARSLDERVDLSQAAYFLITSTGSLRSLALLCLFDQSQGRTAYWRYVLTMLDVAIVERCPTRWEWQVRDRKGTVLIHGWESTRRAARYKADRALFLLLATGWRL